jgi:hypothetical protein
VIGRGNKLFPPRRTRQSSLRSRLVPRGPLFFHSSPRQPPFVHSLHLCVKLCINSFFVLGHFLDTLFLSVAEDQARMNTRWPLRRRNWRIGFPDALSRRALCLVGEHCHSAILVYLYYTRSAGLEAKTYAASLIFRRKVRFLVIQGAVMPDANLRRSG